MKKPEVYGGGLSELSKAIRKMACIFWKMAASCLRMTAGSGSRLWNCLQLIQKFKNTGSQSRIVTACIEKEAADYEILLAHNPVYFDAYKKWGADLVLSGHLHGGIIRLPGIGGLITPQAIPFPKYSGEMTTEGEQTIIVSRGLGTHTINLRFLNEAEMIVIHLRGEKDS